MSRTLMALIAGLCVAGHVAAAPLSIDLKGVRKQTGTVKLKIVDSAEGYDNKAKAVAGDVWKPDGESHQFRFDLPAGQYAVMVIHDANDNGKMDANVIGIPTEPYGFSNNPQVMRKPTFDETRFELPAAGTAISIDLN